MLFLVDSELLQAGARAKTCKLDHGDRPPYDIIPIMQNANETLLFVCDFCAVSSYLSFCDC